MHHESIVWACAEGVKKHHCIADGKFHQPLRICRRHIKHIFPEIFRRLEQAVRRRLSIRKAEIITFHPFKYPEIRCFIIQTIPDFAWFQRIKVISKPDIQSEKRLTFIFADKRLIRSKVTFSRKSFRKIKGKHMARNGIFQHFFHTDFKDSVFYLYFCILR